MGIVSARAEGGGTASPDRSALLDTGALPEVTVIRVEYRAREPALLPALPTTSLHGALERALGLASPDARRLLFDPPPPAEHLPGVTSHPPLPIVLAPEAPMLGGTITLEPGQPWAARVVLLGAGAMGTAPQVISALCSVAEQGVGACVEDKARRPRWELASIATVEPSPPGDPAGDAPVLELVTPLRVRSGGRIAGAVNAELLWTALFHRSDTLARLYGSGPLADRRPPVPFEIAGADLRVIAVRRHSSRQGGRMTWPGLLGQVRLRLAPERPARDAMCRLLRFGELAQLGKATSFGFGRFRLAEAATSPLSETTAPVVSGD